MVGAVLIASVLLAQAAPDAAAQPAVGAAAAVKATVVSPVTVTATKPADAATSGDELVCRNEAVLGTLFPKKVCARRADRMERRRVDQAEIRRDQAQRPWRDPAP
jgi:hypothetical protein